MRVVVSETETLWAAPLPQGTSVQKDELILWMKALELGKGIRVNIYTDRQYAFSTAHVHGTIYIERGLLTDERKTVKNKEEILAFLWAIKGLKKFAIIHCPRHQKGKDLISNGNNRADLIAIQIELERDTILALFPLDPRRFGRLIWKMENC